MLYFMAEYSHTSNNANASKNHSDKNQRSFLDAPLAMNSSFFVH